MAGFAVALVALDGWQWRWPMLGECTAGFAAALIPFGWVAMAVADGGGVEVVGRFYCGSGSVCCGFWGCGDGRVSAVWGLDFCLGLTTVLRRSRCPRQVVGEGVGALAPLLTAAAMVPPRCCLDWLIPQPSKDPLPQSATLRRQEPR
jgi:hypothetical protein